MLLYEPIRLLAVLKLMKTSCYYEPIIFTILKNNLLLIIVDDIVPVHEAVIEVTDWFSLGLKLGIPYHQLERIRIDGHNEIARQRNMILSWFETGHASWSSLVEALKSPLIKKDEIAKQIIKAHPREYDI